MEGKPTVSVLPSGASRGRITRTLDLVFPGAADILASPWRVHSGEGRGAGAGGEEKPRGQVGLLGGPGDPGMRLPWPRTRAPHAHTRARGGQIIFSTPTLPRVREGPRTMLSALKVPEGSALGGK